TEGVEALGPRPLAVLLLEITCGHVADTRVAVDGAEHVLGRDAPHATADDDSELRLMLDALALLRKDDGRARTEDGRRGLEEEERLLRDVVAKLLGVRGVVAPDADDLRGPHRSSQVRGRPCDLDGAEACTLEGGAVETPRSIAVEREPA